MAGKGSGLSGKSECQSNQRYPGGFIAGDAMEAGGGTKNRDDKKSATQANQQLPRGFRDGGQGDYPHGPLTTRDFAGVRAQPNQHLPMGHWDSENTSTGKSGGATRGADAFQGPRAETDEPRMPAEPK